MRDLWSDLLLLAGAVTLVGLVFAGALWLLSIILEVAA